MSPYHLDFEGYNVLDAVALYNRTEGGCTYTVENEYGDAFQHFVLLSSTEHDTFHPEERTYSYQYDGRCNPVEELGPDGLPVTVLWGYDYSLPVARITGATYEAVKAEVGESALAALCSAAQPDEAALGGLKALFPDCLVTTWLHEPSFGVKEETAPNGCRATCSYDALGHPVLLADHDGNPVRRFAYQTSQAAGTPNYVLERTATRADGEAYMEHYGYHDGLGRLTVSLDKGITPAGGNLASLQEYDLAGRKGKAWLPVVTADVAPTTASIRSAAPGQYADDSRPYVENAYEASPRELVTEEHGPGEAWLDKPVSMERLANTAAAPLDCKDYSVGTDGQLVENGKYAAGKLSVTKAADEDGHVVYTFTDMQGRTILTRAMDGTAVHDTYSVYDASGNLCHVLQPMFQEDGDLSKYAFRYEYDERNRLAKKMLPGTEPVLYEYDLKDRMTFSQDGNQRTAGKWTYYLYDGLNRLTEQGECTGKDLSTKTVLLQNYYDDYAFRGSAGFDNGNFPAGTVDATGYLTGTAQRVLDTDKMLHAAYYYDIKGRIVKTVQENTLGGHDVTETVYTFTGNPQTVTHTHSASGKPTVTEVYAYTYDHADRVTKVEHTLDGTKVTLAGYEYDELGRMKARTLHGNAANRQAYAYNIRGWLTNISGNRFMQNLYYETGSGTPAYNGNISSMTWRAGSEGTMRGYKFAYDGLDRLENATYGEGMFINANTGRFSENVTSYDLNGNITDLQRYGQTGSSYGLVDNLTFTLNGNRLDRVDDSATGGLFGDAVK